MAASFLVAVGQRQGNAAADVDNFCILIVAADQQGHHDPMNAETPKAAELNLPQAFLLLATNDMNGKPEVPVYALRTTLAGAILAELDLIGAIGLDGKRVRATGAAPETHLQHELELIRGKSRPHSPKRWVSMFESRAEVQRVYEGMASRGIVEHVGEKHLGRFRPVRYPEKDHAPEAAVLQKIQDALSAPPWEPAKAGAQAPNAKPDAEVPDAAKPDSGAPERQDARGGGCCQGGRGQSYGADRPASGGRTVRQAFPGGRQSPGK